MGDSVPGNPAVDKEYQKFCKMIREACNSSNLNNLDLQTLKELSREAKFLAAEADFYIVVRYQQSTALPKDAEGNSRRKTSRKTSRKSRKGSS